MTFFSVRFIVRMLSSRALKDFVRSRLLRYCVCNFSSHPHAFIPVRLTALTFSLWSGVSWALWYLLTRTRRLTDHWCMLLFSLLYLYLPALSLCLVLNLSDKVTGYYSVWFLFANLFCGVLTIMWGKLHGWCNARKRCYIKIDGFYTLAGKWWKYNTTRGPAWCSGALWTSS